MTRRKERKILGEKFINFDHIFAGPPHITEIIPSNDEDTIEIVLTASGTGLRFSWFLDDVELNDSINGIEINNENNGVQSTLQLSHNTITSAKNLRGIASNIDRTNSSDLRGMGSKVMRNRNDSVQLWLYPVSGKFQIIIHSNIITDIIALL